MAMYTVEDIIQQMTQHLKLNVLFGDKNRNVSRTVNSIVISLYNEGKRPTVYTAEVKTCRYGNPSAVVIDTIINEMGKDVHDMLKVQWQIKDMMHVENTLDRLFEQDCQGSKEDTLKNFSPIGLLYRKNELEAA